MRESLLAEAPPVAAPAPSVEADRPLPEPTRREMGERFGHDFGQVRVHTDARAADGAGALAYAAGPRITFGAGQFRPGTPAGDRLIAHELAHVVQQPGPGGGSAGSSTWEGEADAAADAAMTGGRPRINHHAPTGLVQCQVTPTQTAPTGQPPQGQAPTQTPGQAAQTPGQTPAQTPPVPMLARRESLDPAGRPGFPVLAEYYRDPNGPGVLTVTLRTNITFEEHPPGEDPGKTIARPSADAQETWKRTFRQRVSQAWSFKHYLDLDSPSPGEKPRAVVNVRAVEQTPADVNIHVYSWTPTGWRSDVTGQEMHLDIGDVGENFASHQVVATHEAGHSLGLDHINGTDNGIAAYGTFDQAADIMGSGPTASVTDYAIFAEIMKQITGARWRVTPGIAPPHNYLPLALGFALGVVGAAVGGLLGSLAGPLGAFIGAAIGAAVFGGGTALLFGLTGGVAT